MTNQEQIEAFYTAFAAGDADGMVEHYHDDIIFSDPAFGILKGERAKAMWHMLVERAGGKNKVTYSDVRASGKTGGARWTAKYVYGPKKRPVTNEVTASFIFKDGKIIEHHDDFNLHTWAKQALGVPGLLMGWTGFMRKKVQKTTNRLLDAYLKKSK